MKKLGQEPRLAPGPGLFGSLLTWARDVALVVNPMADAIGNVRAGAKPISETLDAPAFYAYMSANQSVGSAGGFFFLHCDLEEFDTNGRYDTTNWLFQPDVAGYYNFCANLTFDAAAAPITDVRLQFWKNSLGIRQPVLFQGSSGGVGAVNAASGPVFMNGSSDVMQVVGWVSGTSARFLGVSPSFSSFSGHLVRRA